MASMIMIRSILGLTLLFKLNPLDRRLLEEDEEEEERIGSGGGGGGRTKYGCWVGEIKLLSLISIRSLSIFFSQTLELKKKKKQLTKIGTLDLNFHIQKNPSEVLTRRGKEEEEEEKCKEFEKIFKGKYKKVRVE